jgi:hypothetical protein
MVCPIIGPRILRWEERQVNEDRQVEPNVSVSWLKIAITLILKAAGLSDVNECNRLITTVMGNFER